MNCIQVSKSVIASYSNFRYLRYIYMYAGLILEGVVRLIEAICYILYSCFLRVWRSVTPKKRFIGSCGLGSGTKKVMKSLTTWFLCLFRCLFESDCVIIRWAGKKFPFAPPSPVVRFFKKCYSCFWTTISNATPVLTC